VQPWNELSNVPEFTPDDLQQNREGRLSAAQSERLLRQVRKNQQGCLFFTAFVAVFAAVVGFAGTRGIPVGLGFAGASVGLCLPALMTLRTRSQRNLKLGAVQSVHGPVTLCKNRPAPSSGSNMAISVTNFTVKIADERFEVPLSVYSRFHDGQTYTAYFIVLFGNTLLSVELTG
jgi:hypothetical protein